jgi:hypothetical protein
MEVTVLAALLVSDTLRGNGCSSGTSLPLSCLVLHPHPAPPPAKDTACRVLLPSQGTRPGPSLVSSPYPNPASPVAVLGAGHGLPHHGNLRYPWTQPGGLTALEVAVLSSLWSNRECSCLSQCHWLLFPETPGDLGWPLGHTGKGQWEGDETLTREPCPSCGRPSGQFI